MSTHTEPIPVPTPRPTFEKELEQLINSHSRENTSGTPDFLLAEYLLSCLHAFEVATNKRDDWLGPTPNHFKIAPTSEEGTKDVN